MRRVLLVVAVVLAATGVTAAPAYAPTWCPSVMTEGQHWISALSANPNYVSAELGWTGNSYGRLRARTDGNHLGPWELFQLICVQGPDVYAIRSVANGRYVSAELGWTGSSYGLLRARATTIGPWERFRIPATALTTIRSTANGRYVTAEVGWTGSSYGSLRARATAVGDWEYFVVW
jgi:hypothetical protein